MALLQKTRLAEARRNRSGARMLASALVRDYPNSRAAEMLKADERLRDILPGRTHVRKKQKGPSPAPVDPMKRRARQLMMLAQNMQLNGKLKEALKYYEAVVEAAPDSPEAQRARTAIPRIRESLQDR